jgi:DnaJ family protein C protein 17
MSDDLKAHAASSQDFYALLDLSPAANEAEIRRAYRRTALKYHPDKISNPTQSDFEKFHLLQIANDVLSDPSVRQLYDNAREARMRKQRERDMMDAAERKMREELEAGERAAASSRGGPQGVKRPWSSAADDAAEIELQRKIEQIQEDVRRRRVAMQEKRQREMEAENAQAQKVEEEAQPEERPAQRVDRSQEGSVSEEDRSVKVRWVREGRGLDLDADWLKSLLAPFGKVENTVMLKDKRVRVEGKKGKVTLGTGLAVFASIVHAHAAVLDSKQKIRQAQGDWALIESVAWAFGNGPDLKFNASNDQKTAPEESSSTDKPAPSEAPSFTFPGSKAVPKDGKAPTFGSFASAAASMNAPKASSFKTSASSVPSFEEETLMRLRAVQREKEERKALEEQLAREDAEADAAEAKANGS